MTSGGKWRKLVVEPLRRHPPTSAGRAAAGARLVSPDHPRRRCGTRTSRRRARRCACRRPSRRPPAAAAESFLAICRALVRLDPAARLVLRCAEGAAEHLEGAAEHRAGATRLADQCTTRSTCRTPARAAPARCQRQNTRRGVAPSSGSSSERVRGKSTPARARACSSRAARAGARPPAHRLPPDSVARRACTFGGARSAARSIASRSAGHSVECGCAGLTTNRSASATLSPATRSRAPAPCRRRRRRRR